MTKKVVVASDSFKGSATSIDIANYIEEGIHSIDSTIVVDTFAIADGGEGTVFAIVEANNGKYMTVEVKGPLGNPVEATYGLIDNGKTAIIEMAEASGLNLVTEKERDVRRSSTYGTGQLLLDALDHNVERIYIGIGGSATNDGGMGMAQALGVKFTDKNQQLLNSEARYLEEVADIDTSEVSEKLRNTEIIILSDVTNPLCGEQGAAAIYGPQKGATEEDIAFLDASLRHYAGVIKEKLGIDISDEPGAGAAGGLGAGLLVFTGAKLKSGITEILQLINIEKSIKEADLVITGEGRMDSQSLHGKAPIGIAEIAKKYGKPVFAIVGSSDSDMREVFRMGIDGVFDIVYKPMALEEAIKNTAELVKIAARNAINIFLALTK